MTTDKQISGINLKTKIAKYCVFFNWNSLFALLYSILILIYNNGKPASKLIFSSTIFDYELIVIYLKMEFIYFSVEDVT